MTIKEVSEKYHIPQETLRYYEKVGMIPPVTRTPGGIRDFQTTDIGWVETAVCMRNAGLPIEVGIEYVNLSQKGDTTFQERLELLQNQLQVLQEQKKKTEETIKVLEYKISKYKTAVETGELNWDD